MAPLAPSPTNTGSFLNTAATGCDTFVYAAIKPHNAIKPHAHNNAFPVCKKESAAQDFFEDHNNNAPARRCTRPLAATQPARSQAAQPAAINSTTTATTLARRPRNVPPAAAPRARSSTAPPRQTQRARGAAPPSRAAPRSRSRSRSRLRLAPLRRPEQRHLDQRHADVQPVARLPEVRRARVRVDVDADLVDARQRVQHDGALLQRAERLRVDDVLACACVCVWGGVCGGGVLVVDWGL